jgi:hypothetical protein
MERSLFSPLSQAHLQHLETCPRKFQYGVIEQLNWPQAYFDLEPRKLGLQFHQLIQQQEFGLDIQPLLQENSQLQQWLEQLQEAPPPLISGQRHSEQSRTLRLDEFVLVAVYDLLIEGQEQAQIIDWKTYRRPPQLETLQRQWQTRLYPFLLAETSAYTPDQISMGYWFTEPLSTQGTSSHWITFPYSTVLHEETRLVLQGLLGQLREYLTDWTAGRNLPQVPLAAGRCYSQTQRCPFIHYCQRSPEQTTNAVDLMDLAMIAEVPLAEEQSSV